MRRDLVLVRGVSGSGKSTFAELITPHVFSADDYFMRDGKYEFNAEELGKAHFWCKLKTEEAMQRGIDKIAVANTFTTWKELKPYFELAKKYNYRVFSVVVENRHGSGDVHSVPPETLDRQEERFNIKLR